jgi:signal transduction histidine kinase
MEELSNAVERGQGLVTSLLDSVQTRASVKSSPAKAVAAGSNTLDLAAVLRSRDPLFRQMAGGEIHVQSKIAADAKTAVLGEAEFDRILLNLVRNSIDAMPDGGTLKIELAHDASRARPLLLRVTDTGKGIRADLLGHIFESGFSTKPAARDTKSGRGYGLAIVRGLVRAAGGTVRVRSIVGQGTCFTIELPVQLAATPRRGNSHSRNHAPASKKATRTSARTQPTDNFGSHRKGTRVPC